MYWIQGDYYTQTHSLIMYWRFKAGRPNITHEFWLGGSRTWWIGGGSDVFVDIEWHYNNETIVHRVIVWCTTDICINNFPKYVPYITGDVTHINSLTHTHTTRVCAYLIHHTRHTTIGIPRTPTQYSTTNPPTHTHSPTAIYPFRPPTTPTPTHSSTHPWIYLQNKARLRFT